MSDMNLSILPFITVLDVSNNKNIILKGVLTLRGVPKKEQYMCLGIHKDGTYTTHIQTDRYNDW